MNTSLIYWLATLYLPKISIRRFLYLLPFFSSIEQLFKSTRNEKLAKGLSIEECNAFENLDWTDVEKDLAWSSHPLHHVVAYEDSQYPQLLKEISDPPLILFVKGNKDLLNQTQLAIVGSRKATPMGLRNAEYFSFLLAQHHLTITSGLALGIDGAAHRGALTAKGATLAVAGTGLHYIYPPQHKKLAEEILQHDGAIISEFALNTKPLAYNFPRRNRIIAGLSIGILVVEAALKSGSLITAKHALEQGREVFAIPGSIHEPRSHGCHELIRQGAKLVENITDIFAELNTFQPAIAKITVKDPSNCQQVLLNQSEQSLYDQIGYEITSLDVIISASGLTAREVSSMLLILELNGYIQSVAGGYIRSR